MTGHHEEDSIDIYIAAMRRALTRHGLSDAKIVDEVREHLVDAAARARTQGLNGGDAFERAIERFGSPDTVAKAFAADRARVVEAWLLVAALAIGGAIAYIDSRPTWDDTGVTAGALLISAAALGGLVDQSLQFAGAHWAHPFPSANP